MKNYIELLTDDDIKNILKQNNISLFEDLTNRNGNNLPAIERDSKFIFVRCKHEKTKDKYNIRDEIMHMIYKNLPASHILFDTMSNADLIYESAIIFIEDFCIYQISYSDDGNNDIDIKLEKTYHEYMVKKFGKEYVNDYKKYWKKIEKEQKAENTDKEETEDLSL